MHSHSHSHTYWHSHSHSCPHSNSNHIRIRIRNLVYEARVSLPFDKWRILFAIRYSKRKILKIYETTWKTRKEHESKFATENYVEYEFVENSIPPRLGLQFMFIVRRQGREANKITICIPKMYFKSIYANSFSFFPQRKQIY